MRKFITPYERRQRIEALLKLKGWTWYRLAKEMNTNKGTVQHALKVDPHARYDIRVSTIMRAASALGVSAGLLIDRRQPEEEENE